MYVCMYVQVSYGKGHSAMVIDDCVHGPLKVCTDRVCVCVCCVCVCVVCVCVLIWGNTMLGHTSVYIRTYTYNLQT